MLNQIYADVLNKPVLVPDSPPTSIGSGIFAGLAAGVFTSIAEGQKRMCPEHKAYTPRSESRAVYERLYALYRELYFALGQRGAAPVALGDVLPELREIAAQVIRSANG